MDNLDFSGLSDDQLIGLLRATLRECVARGGAIESAARAAGLDEAEKAQIAKTAADREAAKLRAQERERIAKEAAEEVRRQRESQEAAVREAEGRKRQQEQAEAARRTADEAVRKAEERDRERKAWLRRFAALVGLPPSSVHVMRFRSRYGWRVIVNEGSNKYREDHLVDFYPDSAVIHTARSLVGKKRELIALCAEFWGLNPGAETVYYGSEYSWDEQETEAARAS